LLHEVRRHPGKLRLGAFLEHGVLRWPNDRSGDPPRASVK
jgi:hypothetical protein